PRRVAVPGLEERDDVLRELAPPAGSRTVAAHVLLQRLPVARGGHRQVAGQEIVERGDVGRSLDRRVAAQGEDAAAGPSDVAEEELEDRGGADVLHAHRVLGPADRVAERAGALPAGV